MTGNDGKGRRAAERRRERDGTPARDDGASLTRPGAVPINPEDIEEEEGSELAVAPYDPAPPLDASHGGEAALPSRRGRGAPSPELNAEESFVRALRDVQAPDEPDTNSMGENTALRDAPRRKRRDGGRLVVLENGELGTSFPIALTPSLVGRTASAEIQLAEPTVSLRHLEIRKEDDGFVLYDLGSTSGTLVNGVAVDGEVPLRHGDVVALGKLELRFLHDAKAPAPRPLPPPKEPTLIDPTVVLPREKTRTRFTVVQQRIATAEQAEARKKRVRRIAVGVIAACAVILVTAVVGRVVKTHAFAETSPAQVRAQLAQLLAEGNKDLLEQDVDGALASAQTMLALDPGNSDAESLLKMARTEKEARDALGLALRLGDEERDQEAEQILKRIPDSSTFAKDRDRLRRTLAERAVLRSRRAIEGLLERGDPVAALAAAEVHLGRWPDDADARELLARAKEAIASVPKNPGLARARQLFADGDLSGARAAAQEGGYRSYVADLDRFSAAFKKGQEALKQNLDGDAALPHLDEAYRLMPGLGGGAQSAIIRETRKPYGNALYLQGAAKLSRGDRCGAARDLFKAARVLPEDPKIQTQLRALSELAEQGLVRARAARVQDPDRAAALARETLCVAQTGTRTHEDLKQLARF